MANIMSLKDVRNTVHRNGFDLSYSNRFTAKVGQLLPVFVKECMPGDKFKIKPNWFSRTQPLNTAAYARVKEYIDFYFVPYHLLWNLFPDWITQMNDSQFASNSQSKVELTSVCPYFTASSVYNYLRAGLRFSSGIKADGWLQTPTGSTGFLFDIFGFNRRANSFRLLNMLGYGKFFDPYGDVPSTLADFNNVRLSPWRLLAYQKICQDFYRPQMWQSSQPWLFNVNYLTGGNAIPINSSSVLTPFDVQYCLYKKDYFTGVMPSPQFGDVAVAEVGDFDSLDLTNIGELDTSHLASNSFQVDGAFSPSVSVLAIRQAEALQKWKEVSLSASNKSYKEQMKRHFGTSVRGVSDHTCIHLGGSSSMINISEVVNNNLSDGGLASIAGKGIGGGSGTISYDVHEHGIIIGLYHSAPEVDYLDTMLDVHNTKLAPSDFAIPEYDQIGMQVTRHFELFEAYRKLYSPDSILGYAPRYAEYKTSYDVVHGAFTRSLLNYIVPKNVIQSEPTGTSYNFPILPFLYVNPRVMDTVFNVSADSDDGTDQLLVNLFTDCKAVRPLDRNGLPY